MSCACWCSPASPPIEALRAATALPPDRFGLTDRGRIRAGLRADLVLVDGDASVNIGDTLSIRAVWRQGTRLALEPVGVRAWRENRS